jgi:hypothetical protein
LSTAALASENAAYRFSRLFWNGLLERVASARVEGRMAWRYPSIKPGEERMRLRRIIFVMVALAMAVLPSFSAMARNATYVEPRYAGCYCNFGYLGGDNKAECVPATACASEGGRCRGSCRARQDRE